MRGLVYHLLGSRDATDDVLQDAYLKAFRAISSFRGDAAFSTWLYRIVYTTCIDHVRSRQTAAKHRADADVDSAALRATGGVDVAEMVVRRGELQTALAALSPDHYAAVILVDGEGYSYDEVADVLGISPGTVASRLSRARSSLRQSLGAKQGGEHCER